MQSRHTIADDSLIAFSDSLVMSASSSEIGLPPRCEACGMGTARIGKLPRIGLRPLVYVYKCTACNQITTIEPERRETSDPSSLKVTRRPRRPQHGTR
jgi:hypothetical protein